ncbi:MAG: ABC transporter permease [Chitinophagaceae bacterium]|jgi:ABC-2 type transport system permease protein
MSKIWIIIQREYLTRVRNKTFLLSTFLLPLVMVLFIAGSTFFAIQSREKQRIAVVNDPGYFKANLKSDSNSVIFSFDAGVDSLNYASKGYNGILYLPGNGTEYKLISSKQVGLESKSYIRKQLNKTVESHLLQERGIQKTTLDSISEATDNAVELTNVVLEKDGKAKQANAGLAYGIGFGSGILIYMTMFIFGAMVMRGVAEEKTNRIAEVIVSSCKPFELMFGKIIGIAAVGLTQFLLWIGLIMLIFTAVQLFLPAETLQQVQEAQQAQQNLPGEANNTMALKLLQAKTTITEGANWWVIIPSFLFYFLGGYLFYASLFAAIGSVINEDPQEAQSLMLPITMPIIFGFIILTSSLQNPNSPVAVWGSIIPFTSPIVMMGRIPFGVPDTVPYWQLALSMLSLIGGFLFTTWFAGRVYRTGILMYGKKPSWKEMIKWAFKS